MAIIIYQKLHMHFHYSTFKRLPFILSVAVSNTTIFIHRTTLFPILQSFPKTQTIFFLLIVCVRSQMQFNNMRMKFFYLFFVA